MSIVSYALETSNYFSQATNIISTRRRFWGLTTLLTPKKCYRAVASDPLPNFKGFSSREVTFVMTMPGQHMQVFSEGTMIGIRLPVFGVRTDF